MSNHPDASPYLSRIQALLDKAESTSFPEEADALFAKAQELMARHAIDEAMLTSAATSKDEIEVEEVVVEAPYAGAKSHLLAAVGHANRCRVVTLKRPGGTELCSLVGHRTDVANVRTLFASLLVQAVRSMVDASVPVGDTPRRFRHSFLLSYSARIGQRLREAEHAVVDAVQAEQFERPGEPSVTLVLASRAARVDQAMAAAFPGTRTRRSSASSAAGYRSGHAAANRASLGHQGIGGSGRALPSG